MASPSKNQHYPNEEQSTKKRPKVSRRELDTLNDNNSKRARRDLPKCPICEYRIEPMYWAEHYQYELNRLSETTSEAYSNTMNKNHGKRGAAVAARRQLEGKGKKKVSVYEETLEKVQKNRSKRKDRLKQIIDSNSFESTAATSTTDDSHHVALMLQQQENGADVQTCFICQQQLYGDLEDINLHIDSCLSNPASVSMQESEQEIEEEEEEEEYIDDIDNPNDNIETSVQEPTPAAWEEYEWAGQVRVRASAMMEGGYGGAGFATASKTEVDDDDDEDLDVEDDDAAQFGVTQYTERDIVVNMDENNENDSALREMVSGGSVRTPTLESGDQQRQDFEATVSVSGWDQHLNKKENYYTNSSSSTKNQSSLIIDSLKARIHELESASKSSNCLICLENYKTPLTSIVCWHVHCEQCWLHTLGTKKLCPQCQKITTPSDLRRIYL